MEFFVDFNRQSDSSGLQQRLRRRKQSLWLVGGT